MHIVVLAEFAVASGGAEKVAVESARGLANAGIDVTYIQAIDGPVDPLLDHPRITRVCLGNADIWSRPAHRAAFAGIWNADAARRLGAALARLPTPPDLVHLHQWTRSLSPSVFGTLFKQGVPVVATLHDYFLACPNGVYYRFDQDEPCTLAPLSAACLVAPCDGKSRLHKLVRVGRTAALRGALRGRAFDVIHVSDASRTRMGALLGDLALTHHRVDNPVRVMRDVPADPARGDAIAYVGRLTREKGADLVAQAAAAAGLPALFIGAGPLEAELRAFPNVEVVGWQAPDAVWRTLRTRARAIAAPSRWFETGPLTVYEALACGLPVVASTRAGAAEKVVDGVTGFAVAPEVDAFAHAFRRLADDDCARSLGLAAHARYWAAPMTESAHAQALIQVYDDILTARSLSSTTGIAAA
ncbi:glycosyltransferase family 4 protein [Methylobacterium sp. BTF04]|uniref:glycosyltransferase family 4 protein n=1 Tax=Methylobacterium sp. BTF04 TaxID=2708300 RepID=UPI0013CF626B|nr:glycosyltransferase family 4 protein [Methylobacterium sp. BTF04]NEU11495.1 glycosyltransferase family 4 protein [Methylobacterium sp. BTF04]